MAYFHIITMEILLLLYLLFFFGKCPDNYMTTWPAGSVCTEIPSQDEASQVASYSLSFSNTRERSLDKDASDWRTLGSNQPQR
jgi:hypothetical protein